MRKTILVTFAVLTMISCSDNSDNLCLKRFNQIQDKINYVSDQIQLGLTPAAVGAIRINDLKKELIELQKKCK